MLCSSQLAHTHGKNQDKYDLRNIGCRLHTCLSLTWQVVHLELCHESLLQHATYFPRLPFRVRSPGAIKCQPTATIFIHDLSNSNQRQALRCLCCFCCYCCCCCCCCFYMDVRRTTQIGTASDPLQGIIETT